MCVIISNFYTDGVNRTRWRKSSDFSARQLAGEGLVHFVGWVSLRAVQSSRYLTVNERLEQRLNRQRAIALPRHSRWYDGRPIMISRNDSALGLFNGDIGIALERNGELRVWFLMPDGAIKSVQPSRLPEHDTAWAMTVHKSQGSEFEHAALILPARSVPLVTRELVYTAITRAKRRLSLYADEQVLSQAIVTRTERRSGLAEIFAGRETP